MTAFRFPFSRSTVLGALVGNESGGRNIANTHQGTSSGQAQGYFQITTGTWKDFGGRKYAATPLGATPAQQWDIARRIPLKRWDTSTLRAMRATGKAIDPNRTLGENASMHNEDFDTSGPVAVLPHQGPTPSGKTLDYVPPQQGPTQTGETLDAKLADPNPPPAGLFPPAENELTKADDKKQGMGGLLGSMGQQQRPKQMQNLLPQGGSPQPSLAEIIQQYMQAQMRGGAPPGGAPVITPPQGGRGLG
jgi:Transglycosylase-like domain